MRRTLDAISLAAFVFQFWITGSALWGAHHLPDKISTHFNLEATSYPVEVTDENRARLEALYLDLLTWIKTEVVCLFAWIQWNIIESARLLRLSLSPVALVGGPLVVIFTTVAWYNLAMRRAGRSD